MKFVNGTAQSTNIQWIISSDFCDAFKIWTTNNSNIKLNLSSLNLSAIVKIEHVTRSLRKNGWQR